MYLPQNLFPFSEFQPPRKFHSYRFAFVSPLVTLIGSCLDVSFPCPLAHMSPNFDDIEKLSRGESTRGKIGNRGVGHRLTQKERILFEAAKRNGFLKIPVTGIRKNVINIYKLWCQASDRPFVTK